MNTLKSTIQSKTSKYYNRPGRPVITGIGIVSPIGIGKDEFWKNLLAGETGLDRITLFDASTFPCNIAAEVKDFHPEKYLNERQLKYYSRATQFACAAFNLAKADASLDYFDPYRTDVIIGAAQISFASVEEEIQRVGDEILKFDEDMDSTGILKTTISIPASAIANIAQIEGYVSTVASACSSGIDAIGIAANRIKNNEADCVICGGVDTPITGIILNAFSRAKMLTTENEDPKKVLFPFDERHTKSALGEGSAIFILEDRDKAIARGARIYAEIENFSQATENTNEVFMPEKSSKKWMKVIQDVLGRKNRKVEHINAHGPSDKKIDQMEAKALAGVFGNKSKKIPVTSIKGAVAAGMAASSSFQVAAGALSVYTGIIPPTYNYTNPDSESELNCSNKSREKFRIQDTLVNGHGLGGVNSAVLLKEF